MVVLEKDLTERKVLRFLAKEREFILKKKKYKEKREKKCKKINERK